MWFCSTSRMAGLHPAVLEYAADRKIALLGSDGNNDTAPSTVLGVDFPVHVLAIAALGVHLIDYLDFSALAPLCAEFRQWSFLCVVAPAPAGPGHRLTGQPDRDLVSLRVDGPDGH
jgi:hypothetical protein